MILSFLNIIDALATYIGLKKGWIMEANPLMNSIAPEMMLGIKVLFSIILLFIGSKIPNKKYINTIGFIALAVYIGVSVVHIYWIENIFAKG